MELLPPLNKAKNNQNKHLGAKIIVILQKKEIAYGQTQQSSQVTICDCTEIVLAHLSH